MSDVNNIHFGAQKVISGPGHLVQGENGQIGFVPVNLDQPAERFENSQAKPKKEFSYINATGRFLQGAVIDTLDNVFSVKGLIGIGLSAAAVAAFGTPALIVLGAVGAICGATGMLSGINRSKQLYADGKVNESENAFRGVGVGFSSLALSVAGLRTTAKTWLEGGKTKVMQLGEDSKAAGQNFFKSLKVVAQAFVGKDGKTLQLPQLDAALWITAKGLGQFAQNGTIASGAALTNLYSEGEALKLKDKMNCIN